MLAARPFQVDPPYQFLNGGGGVAPLHRLECKKQQLEVDSSPRVAFEPAPAACGTLAFDEGPLLERLAKDDFPRQADTSDPTGLPTAAMRWAAELAPGAALEVIASVPFTGAPEPEPVSAAAFAAAAVEAREAWRAALDRVGLELPPEAAPLGASLRSNLAWILVHRDGAGIQPGSRAYARSWIRDGALTGVALLRLRHGEEAAEFASWFAEHQYPDGKVPCCFDRRGADPVPDTTVRRAGALFAEATYPRLAFAERLFPAGGGGHAWRRSTARPPPTTPRADQLFFGLLPSRSAMMATPPSRCTPR